MSRNMEFFTEIFNNIQNCSLIFWQTWPFETLLMKEEKVERRNYFEVRQ